MCSKNNYITSTFVASLDKDVNGHEARFESVENTNHTGGSVPIPVRAYELE